MSKKSTKSTKSVDLNEKVTVVYLIQSEKRMLLNYFHDYETARSYVRAFSHFKINGELLIGEVTLKSLIEED